MKAFFLVAILAILLSGCGVFKPVYRCTPSKKSKDYAVRQWMKQRSDGYWVVTTIHGFKNTTTFAFECKPDSAALSKL